ncbi:MAG: GNAT family N-acetyltransferase [Fimbriimonadaceae bacterium]|nr:GNAT family N-acetyltransferase [Chitinophagales bacterium]
MQQDQAHITIRKAKAEDVNLLSELAALTFRGTYAQFNTKENMDAYIQDHFTVDIMLKEILDTKFQYFLAYYDEEIAGYCLLDTNRTTPQLQIENTIEISRIYVAEKFKGKKIGKLLMDTCINYAVENMHTAIWLGVWQENKNAIAFYQHCGFEIIGTTEFVLGDDVQHDFIMKKQII